MMKYYIKFKTILAKNKNSVMKKLKIWDEKTRKNIANVQLIIMVMEEPQNINERWMNLKDTIINTATKTLGHKNNTIRKEYTT